MPRLVSPSPVEGWFQSFDRSRDTGNPHRLQGYAVDHSELEVRCILVQIGILKLESVIFVKELEVPFSLFSDYGVIGIKGQLSMKPTAKQAA